MCCQRMIVRYKKKAIKLILHPDKILHRAEIISQVKVPGASYSTYYNFFHAVKISNEPVTTYMQTNEFRPVQISRSGLKTHKIVL